MSLTSALDVTELIDQRPLGALQIRIIVLCGLVALLDGFDLLAIGVAAPAMSKALQIPPNQLGTVLSSALFGLMLGALVLGPIADRFGRKLVLVGATLIFGAFTVCTAGAATWQQVVLYRFLAGFGLGGAMPSFISLTAEYTPRSYRQVVVGLLWTGFPLGGVIVGVVASRLIDAAGWQSLFYTGGIVPLVLSIILIAALPDSLEFLVSRGTQTRRIRELAIRINPTVNIGAGCRLITSEEKTRGEPVWYLFAGGQGYITGLLWASYFVTFLLLVTCAAWTPTLLRRAGIDGADSSLSVALFSFGSVIGTPLAGFLGNRFGAQRVLPLAFIASALTLAGVGEGSHNIGYTHLVLALAGFFLGIASSGLIALTPLLYSTPMRSTGAGWAMGIGRFGSFAGPLIIGLLVERGWQLTNSFIALGAAAVSAAVFTSLIRARSA